MASKKENAKKLKEPDQFQARGAELIDTIIANQKAIALVVVALVVLAAGTAGWQWHQANQLEAQAMELGEIKSKYEDEIKQVTRLRTPIQLEIAKLQEEVKKLEEDKKNKKNTKTIEETNKKIEELTAKREAVLPDHSESAKLYREFFEKYNNSAAGWMAGIQAANIYLENNKLQEAHDLIQKVLTSSKKDNFYQTYPRFTLVSILEDLGKFDDALSQLDIIVSLGNEKLLPRVLLAKSRIQYLKNDFAKAKETVAIIIQNHGQSPEAQKAKSLKLLLN